MSGLPFTAKGPRSDLHIFQESLIHTWSWWQCNDGKKDNTIRSTACRTEAVNWHWCPQRSIMQWGRGSGEPKCQPTVHASHRAGNGEEIYKCPRQERCEGKPPFFQMHFYFFENRGCTKLCTCLFLYLFSLAALGLRCPAPAFSSCSEQGLLSNCAVRACHCRDFSCGAQAVEHGLQESQLTGLAAPWLAGSSQTRDWTHVPCIGRWFLTSAPPRKPQIHIWVCEWTACFPGGPEIILDEIIYYIVYSNNIIYIVQEAGIKTIPKKKKCKKAKRLSEEALQTAVRREVKGKGEKERYTHLNAEFQRIKRRD